MSSYNDWFKETFTLDQTTLVNNLANREGILTFYNFPDYYISTYEICLENEEVKELFIKKHEDLITRESAFLKETLLKAVERESNDFLTAELIKEIKESVQEIEVQKEIIRLINENLISLPSQCKWYPFSNKILFDIFKFAKLPLASTNDNYWLGIFPERVKYKRQLIFFSLLGQHPLPEDKSLIITKLHTWADIEYKKNLPMEPISELQKHISDPFRINARKIAMQKMLDSWEAAYSALHSRGL